MNDFPHYTAFMTVNLPQGITTDEEYKVIKSTDGEFKVVLAAPPFTDLKG